MITSKLDPETQAKWEEETCSIWNEQSSLQVLSLPTWNDLSKFLERRCKTLEIVSRTSSPKQIVSHRRPLSNPHSSSTNRSELSSYIATNQTRCCFCNSTPSHNAFNCRRFNEMSTYDRFRTVKKMKLCINCLGVSHLANSCPSNNKCQHCKAAHHTLLHRGQMSQCSPTTNNQHTKEATSMETESPVALQALKENNQVILGTARVELQAPNGRSVTVRALLDSGSQLHFITEKIAHYLRVQRNKVNIKITGIANKTSDAFTDCRLRIKSSTNEYSTPITAVIIPSITSYQPQKLDIDSINIPSNIRLADKHFYKPGAIDLLIGAGLFYELLMVGQIKADNLPIFQKTSLGWIVTGEVKRIKQEELNSNIEIDLNSPQQPSSSQSTNNNNSNHTSDGLFSFVCLHSATKPLYTTISNSGEPLLEHILERFWRIEQPICDNIRTAEEEECERFFEETTTRCPRTNKFIVRLPFKIDPQELGSSIQIATNRFYSLEKRLCSNEVIRNQYSDFINEYISMQHMVKAESDTNSKYNYIPHHCIIKPDSSTTKLRVVFDGSCRTSNGLSLNSVLRVGPTLQEDIFSILLRFRFHKFVLVADIAKMYRQVLVNENDVHWQSIVWRDNPRDNLSTYVLKTVTYGTSCAPYLAVKCLQVLANECASEYPVGSRVTLRDFYVDNLMTGADSIDEVIEIKRQVFELLRNGGFPLRKFAANHEDILADVPDSEKEEIVKVDGSEYIKTLGLKWLPQKDNFSYLSSQQNLSRTIITKRQILAQTASVFDPLGLVNPIVVRCKLLLQRIWSLKLHWDESVPQNISTEWVEIQGQLKMITKMQIPRYVKFNNYTNIHAFADASSKAYGACVYAVTGENSSRLLCSKSRVAPLKPISLPRLELCAALLLTQLLKSVLKTLPEKPHKIICWSDSTITLHWISGDSSRWKPFVNHRVVKIKQTIPTAEWRHIPSQLNPADILSRGSNIDTLTLNKLWFHGPEFLQQNEIYWPVSSNTYLDDVDLEVRKTALPITKHTMNIDFALHDHKYINSYEKLIRIFAYVYRYTIAFMSKEEPKTGPFEAEELNKSLELICRFIQHQSFAKELQCLKSNKSIDRQSKLYMLSPFVHNGLIRVGGRLNNSKLPFSVKHPIVLPSSHKFVPTIIQYYHRKNFHAGVQTLHNIIRETLWIIKGKQTIRQVIHNCLFCYRFRPIAEHQIMGALPADRVSQSYPFAVTGVDYCGPFYITQQIRGRPPLKVYMAVFICFSVKAVHLELVPDLTTNAFIAALKRFIARRGRCSTIYSDNATNFIGANKELKDMLKHFLSEQHKKMVYDSCVQEGIEWKFIPPRSPHFGGLWESSVKQAKYYIRRAIGYHILTFDELHTVCCQTEAIINSRPLTPISSDPNDLRPLTPAHFLIGRPLSTILEPSMSNVNSASLKRYHILRWIHQEFWDRWRNEYLKTLQQRTKWATVQPNLKNNDLVLIKEDSTPPLTWPLGRVLETYSGNDGQVRVALVKTAEGVFKRSVTKLCKLPLEAVFEDNVGNNVSKAGENVEY